MAELKDLIELRRQKGELIAKMRGIMDAADGRPLTRAQDADFQKLEAQVSKMTAREDQMVVELDLPAPEGRSHPLGGLGEPMEAPIRRSGDVLILAPEQRVATSLGLGSRGQDLRLDRCLRGIVTGNWREAEAEKRAMAEGLDALGGYAVPEALSAEIIDLARNQARVFQAGARTVPMTSDTLNLARITGDPTATWKAENAQGSFSDMSLGRLSLHARTLMVLVKSSVELLEDASSLSVENSIAAALALELDRAALYGLGAANEPLGLRNWEGINTYEMGVNGAVPANYDWAAYAVEYVRNSNYEPASIILNPRTLGTLSRLKTGIAGDNTPLAAPQVWLDLKKYPAKQVPTNLAQGNTSDNSDAFIGDFSQMMVGMRTSVRLEVSREAGDSFRDLQVIFRAYLRADVAVAQPGAFCLVKGIRA